jgi:hypothetical protein
VDRVKDHSWRPVASAEDALKQTWGKYYPRMLYLLIG